MSSDENPNWHLVSTVAELSDRGKIVFEIGERPVLVLWNSGNPVALDDTCIHRERSLSEGTLLGTRLVCPGHQWAFDLETGYCAARDRYQPVHEVRVDADQVMVALTD
jgi:nitrite reductase (NADH) small subunit